MTPPAAPQSAAFTDADFTKYLTEKGMVATTPDDIQKGINEAVGNTHKAWEGKLAEVTGVVRPEGAQRWDYLATAVQAKPAPETPKSETPAPKVADDVAAAELKLLKKQLEEITEREQKTTERTVAKVITLDRESTISNTLDSKDADYAGKAIMLRAALGANYVWKTDELDNVIPYDKDGEVMINPATQRPFTSTEIVKRDFGFLLPKPKPQVAGTGVIEPAKITTDNDGKPTIIAKTYEEISIKAAELGLERGTPDWMGFMERSQKASGIK